MTAALAAGLDLPRLRVTGLARRFGARVALEGLSFEVAPGEVFGLLGPNGAGKTTAFRLLSGLVPPDAGTVALDGRIVSPAARDYRARLGVVFQEPSLDLKLTGRENLRLGAALYGLPRAVAAGRIDEALRVMDLGARADEATAKYSGGMRRRIEIARVLLHEPDLLLLDEPGRGVDPDALRRIWDELAARKVARGMSIIVTTHQPEEAERCDRIALLDGGRVTATGTPDELRARVAGDVVRVRGDRPEELAETIRTRLGLPGVVLDGDVVLETPRGHEVVPRVVELFAPGRLASVATSRPTLADVFAKLTGRGLAS
ncbi:MAG TPA: ATP-binding cassette domain-containing protein [Polyangia bacterium]|jgi:ABC-2 type transport system ATP-binding protein|nr:ATP-binding cassette domain-containing protein [Polyangia bacterium]